MTDLRILAFDTSGPFVTAAVLKDGSLLAASEIDMARGQAEALVPFLEAQLEEAGIGWDALDLIAVGVGPGNFTGIRISVAAARGFALSLGIPAMGVSAFETLRDPDEGYSSHPADLVSVPAPREQAYVQAFRFERADGEARLIDPTHPPRDLARMNLRVLGHRADEIAAAFGVPHVVVEVANRAARIARIAEWRWSFLEEKPGRPAPLYVRPADAAPASDPPPVILP